MEILAVSPTSFKIKSKNTSFIINPVKIDADVVLTTTTPHDYSQFEGKLVISGPGDYEVSGVSIKGEKMGDGVAYTLLEENQTILILPSNKNVSTDDSENVTATVMILSEKLDEAVNVSSELFVVVASEDLLPQDLSNVKKVDKVNLKKIEEYKGSIVHLSK